jgi:hypothetical protein
VRYGVGIPSRSNSVLFPPGKAVMRSINILSLLSRIPTAMRVSHGTDRLLGLDLDRDEKVLAERKEMDPVGGVGAVSSQRYGFVLSTPRGSAAQL